MAIDLGAIVLAVSALCLLAGLAMGSLALRRVAGLVVLGGLATFLTWQSATSPDLTASPWATRQLPFLLVGTVSAILGVAFRRAWGRWLAIGSAALS